MVDVGDGWGKVVGGEGGVVGYVDVGGEVDAVVGLAYKLWREGWEGGGAGSGSGGIGGGTGSGVSETTGEERRRRQAKGGECISYSALTPSTDYTQLRRRRDAH